jgi:diadenosine tetraphosphate (Ap4A) HIT family hydrolase/5-methylcytosine-specific restriction endonuclease McrA
MAFADLAKFITRDMRMSHIYQPVMLLALLRNGGRLPASVIAKELLQHDESQIEYYTAITHNMVGKVLRNRGVVEKDGQDYILNGFPSLKANQVKQLIAECNTKLEEYKAKRGDAIWQHRRMSVGYISGTLKYEVLKRARFHCELCGVPAREKALEVDHIVPRNKGGSDDVPNLQALCYSCNAMKRDRDNTDFRERFYDNREKGCLFCEIPTTRVVAQNELAYLVRDGFPVTPLHSLIIPKRHVVSYFDLRPSEISRCHALSAEAKAAIEKEDSDVTGFNLGINSGEAAGQSVFHCHIHLIPRRRGDVEKPRGGVRHVIPGKGSY